MKEEETHNNSFTFNKRIDPEINSFNENNNSFIARKTLKKEDFESSFIVNNNKNNKADFKDIQILESLEIIDINLQKLDDLVLKFKSSDLSIQSTTEFTNTTSMDKNDHQQTTIESQNTYNNEKFNLEVYLNSYIDLEDKLLILFGKISKDDLKDANQKSRLETLLLKFNLLWGSHQNTWSDDVWETYYKQRGNYEEISVDKSLNYSLLEIEVDENKKKTDYFPMETALNMIDDDLSKLEIKTVSNSKQIDNKTNENKNENTRFICGKSCVFI